MCAMGVFGLDQNLAHREWHWLQMRLEGCDVLQRERGEEAISRWRFAEEAAWSPPMLGRENTFLSAACALVKPCKR